ncbi:MAG: hypothetical protein DRO52_04730, partial [Candidatus Hecatellales archaeon]
PDTYSVNYAHEKYGVEYVAGYCFDQWVIDWMSMRGGWQAPYYGRQDNIYVPNPKRGGVVVIPHVTWDWVARFVKDHHYNSHLENAKRVLGSWEKAVEYCEALIDRTLEGLQPFGYARTEFEFDQLYKEGGLPYAKKYYERLIKRTDVVHMTNSEFVEWFKKHYPKTPIYTITYVSPIENLKIEWYYSPEYRIARMNGKIVSYIKYQEQKADKYLNQTAKIDRTNYNWNPSNHIDTSLAFKIHCLGGGKWNPKSYCKGIPYSGKLKNFPQYYKNKYSSEQLAALPPPGMQLTKILLPERR